MSLPLQILLIEADVSSALVAASTLGNAGHVVHHVQTGTRGIASFCESGFDLVMTSYYLPDMSGFEIADLIRAEELRAGRPSTPIIGLSSCEDLNERRRGTQGGMDAVMSKPIRSPDLLSLVARFGAGIPRPVSTGTTDASMRGPIGGVSS